MCVGFKGVGYYLVFNNLSLRKGYNCGVVCVLWRYIYLIKIMK